MLPGSATSRLMRRVPGLTGDLGTMRFDAGQALLRVGKIYGCWWSWSNESAPLFERKTDEATHFTATTSPGWKPLRSPCAAASAAYRFSRTMSLTMCEVSGLRVGCEEARVPTRVSELSRVTTAVALTACQEAHLHGPVGSKMVSSGLAILEQERARGGRFPRDDYCACQAHLPETVATE